MSLINQMLNDLQQRKKSGNPQADSTDKVNRMLTDLQQEEMVDVQKHQEPTSNQAPRKNRSLFLPAALGGVVVILLCIAWWMTGEQTGSSSAGIPVPKPVGNRPVAASGQQQVPAPPPAIARQELVPKPAAQHEAEPVEPAVAKEEGKAPAAAAATVKQAQDASSVMQRVATKPIEPAEAKSTSKEQAPQVDAVKQERATAAAEAPDIKKPVVVKNAPDAGKTATAPETGSKATPPVAARTAATSQPAKNSSITVPPEAAEFSRQMKPEQLPGALSTPKPAIPKVEAGVAASAPQPGTLPDTAEDGYLLGRQAYSQSRDREAAGYLRHALALYPGHFPARELLIEILAGAGNDDEVASLLKSGLAIAPDYMVFKKMYAQLLFDQGVYEAAIGVLMQGGLPKVSDDREAHALLASLYQQLDESYLAAQTYRNLLVYWPDDGEYWVGLGDALENQGQSAEAADCYQRALETRNLRRELSLYASSRLNSTN